MYRHGIQLRNPIVLVAVCTAFVSGCLCPPNPKAEEERTYGSPSNIETAIAIRETTDGGVILAGYRESYQDGSQDIYLVKTNARYEVVWERTLGGSNFDIATAVRPLSGGGFILAGIRYADYYEGADALLMQVDGEGHEVWAKTFGGGGEDEANDVEVLDDGGFVFAGTTSTFGLGERDLYLVRTDADGNERWHKTFGGLFDDAARAVRVTPDGGFIVAGSRYIADDGRDEIYIVKTDADGNTDWTRAIAEGDFGYQATSIAVLPGGGYAIAGFGFDYGPGAFVLRLDEDGQNSDTKFSLFGDVDGFAEFNSLAALPNGDVIAAGSTGIFCVSVYVTRISPAGRLVWERKFGGSEYDFGLGAIVTSDNEVVVVGGTGDIESGDAYLVQTDLNGN